MQKKVGAIGLLAVCISGMIGGGVFNLPQNMASVASPSAQAIAWLVVGAGMLCVAFSFQLLSAKFPQLTNGLYSFATHAFGKRAGFFVAFNYVLYNTCTCAAYGVMSCSALNLFFPHVFEGGNSWVATLVSSLLCWAIFALMLKGTTTSVHINVVATLAKLVPVVLFLLTMGAAILLAHHLSPEYPATTPLDASLSTQVANTMPITMFAFLGIEGAVVISGAAKSKKTVGTVTVLGFLLVLAIYVATSLMPFCVATQAQLAGLPTPSTASLLQALQLPVLATLVSAGVIISALAAWFVFTLMLVQMPPSAARDNLFPRVFAATNKRGAPVAACVLEALLCQALILIAHFLSGSTWTQLISMAAVLSMPCYGLSAAAALKLGVKTRHIPAIIVGSVGTAFCAYAFFSGGVSFLGVCALVYAIGAVLYVLYTQFKRTKAQ